jgi:hypothetical protein
MSISSGFQLERERVSALSVKDKRITNSGAWRPRKNSTPNGLWMGLLLAFWLLGTATPCQAGEVIMKNGDRIQGTVISMTQGKLVYKTEYAGEITIKWDQVAKLTTEKPLEVTLTDDKRLEGKVATAQSGELLFYPEDGASPSPVTMAQIKSMERPKPPATWDFTGNIKAGASKETGNTNTEKYSFIGNLKIFKMPHVFKFYGEFHKEWSKNVLSKDNWLGSGTYERFLTKKWFLWGGGVAQSDKFKDLTLRANAAVGPGYQVWNSSEKNLSLKLGPGYTYEKYSKMMKNFGNVDHREYFSGYWVLDFDMWFFGKLFQVFHHDDFLYDFEDSANWVVRTRTGINLPLISKLFASFQFNYDFDNQPADGKDKYDQYWIFSIGWAF